MVVVVVRGVSTGQDIETSKKVERSFVVRGGGM